MPNLTRWTLAAAATLVVSLPIAPAPQGPPDLTGLWAARVRFGPDIRGALTLLRGDSGWRADIAGFSVPARVDGQGVSFELPDEKGSFRGKVNGRDIVGHWVGQRTQNSGLAYATPVVLRANGPNRWRGDVIPLDDAFTFYMPVTRRGDGTYAAYLRNPERNQGIFIPVSRIELKGDVVALIGRRDGQAEVVLSGGTVRRGCHPNTAPWWEPSISPRSRATRPAPSIPAASVASRTGMPPPLAARRRMAGCDRRRRRHFARGIERFVQKLIDMPMDSLSTSQIHSLLIARHGKLVVEEYFHGYHRDLPHDTRSAAKSWTAVLLGAAMQAGVPIHLDTPVYRTMLDSLPRELDPRKRAMTLEHLISMTAGYDCEADSSARQRGCDAEPDGGAGLVSVYLERADADRAGRHHRLLQHRAESGRWHARKVAGEPLPDLFYRLVARPLEMSHYHLLLSPTGEAYGGGGHHFLPRDFLKLAQLMVNDGRWNGRQIVSRDWARKSGSALRNLTQSQQYGWLWNSVEYPYKGGQVRGFFAAGNGGQIFMGIPQLDLVIGFTGGNYNDAALFIPQRVFVPERILPAVN